MQFLIICDTFSTRERGVRRERDAHRKNDVVVVQDVCLEDKSGREDVIIVGVWGSQADRARVNQTVQFFPAVPRYHFVNTDSIFFLEHNTDSIFKLKDLLVCLFYILILVFHFYYNVFLLN